MRYLESIEFLPVSRILPSISPPSISFSFLIIFNFRFDDLLFMTMLFNTLTNTNLILNDVRQLCSWQVPSFLPPHPKPQFPLPVDPPRESPQDDSSNDSFGPAKKL